MSRLRKPKQIPRNWIWLIAGLLLLLTWHLLEPADGPALSPAPENARTPVITTTSADTALAFLPREAHATLALIDRGGPYPYRQDDGVFQNRERLLPPRPRGHYREYTVDTPGLRTRGARRIVTGGDPPSEWFYTADHYRSFRAFQRRDR